MKLAVYDTGYGLSIAPEMGDITSTIDVVSTRLFKIQMPNNDDPKWEDVFERQKLWAEKLVKCWNENNQEGR